MPSPTYLTSQDKGLNREFSAAWTDENEEIKDNLETVKSSGNILNLRAPFERLFQKQKSWSIDISTPFLGITNSVVVINDTFNTLFNIIPPTKLIRNLNKENSFPWKKRKGRRRRRRWEVRFFLYLFPFSIFHFHGVLGNLIIFISICVVFYLYIGMPTLMLLKKSRISLFIPLVTNFQDFSVFLTKPKWCVRFTSKPTLSMCTVWGLECEFWPFSGSAL